MFHRLRERVVQALDENARAAGILLEGAIPVPVLEAPRRRGNGPPRDSPLVSTRHGGIRRGGPAEDGD